jgi:hypothetical protein
VEFTSEAAADRDSKPVSTESPPHLITANKEVLGVARELDWKWSWMLQENSLHWESWRRMADSSCGS